MCDQFWRLTAGRSVPRRVASFLSEQTYLNTAHNGRTAQRSSDGLRHTSTRLPLLLWKTVQSCYAWIRLGSRKRHIVQERFYSGSEHAHLSRCYVYWPISIRDRSSGRIFVNPVRIDNDGRTLQEARLRDLRDKSEERDVEFRFRPRPRV